jgi:hypothetical protein
MGKNNELPRRIVKRGINLNDEEGIIRLDKEVTLAEADRITRTSSVKVGQMKNYPVAKRTFALLLAPITAISRKVATRSIERLQLPGVITGGGSRSLEAQASLSRPTRGWLTRCADGPDVPGTRRKLSRVKGEGDVTVRHACARQLLSSVNRNYALGKLYPLTRFP